MVAPEIDERLYTPEIRATVHKQLETSYRGINRLPNGTYNPVNEEEEKQISQGYAFSESVVIADKSQKKDLETALLHMFGALDKKNNWVHADEAASQPEKSRNFRFVRPLPDRTKQSEKENKNCFALYIRVQMPPAKKKLR